MRVAILMATYNGERYIGEQIESIQNQNYKDWQLFIRDDCSTDGTLSIIKGYQKNDSRIILIEDNKGNLGPLKNFNELLHVGVKSDIILLADQDDVWFPYKITCSIDELNKLPNPVKLVYTNFNNWNPDKNQLVAKYGMENPEYKNLVWQNWIFGCTMCFTKELGLLSLNIPDSAVNHDNWIANVANLYGDIGYLKKPTINHRIHDNNVTTSSKSLLGQYYSFLKETLFIRKIYVKEKLIFVNQLLNIGSDEGQSKSAMLITKEILEIGGIRSIIKFKKNKFQAFTKLQTLLIYLCIL